MYYIVDIRSQRRNSNDISKFLDHIVLGALPERHRARDGRHGEAREHQKGSRCLHEQHDHDRPAVPGLSVPLLDIQWSVDTQYAFGGHHVLREHFRPDHACVGDHQHLVHVLDQNRQQLSRRLQARNGKSNSSRNPSLELPIPFFVLIPSI